MREDVSRRKALSVLGTALGFALALTDAEAQTTGTKGHHTKRPTVQRATAPAEPSAEFRPTNSISTYHMAPPGEKPHY
jgi:hypothetical protein